MCKCINVYMFPIQINTDQSLIVKISLFGLNSHSEWLESNDFPGTFDEIFYKYSISH